MKKRQYACWGCKGIYTTVLRCGKCRSVQYCSAECQRADWPQHKPTCGDYPPIDITDQYMNDLTDNVRFMDFAWGMLAEFTSGDDYIRCEVMRVDDLTKVANILLGCTLSTSTKRGDGLRFIGSLIFLKDDCASRTGYGRLEINYEMEHKGVTGEFVRSLYSTKRDCEFYRKRVMTNGANLSALNDSNTINFIINNRGDVEFAIEPSMESVD